MRTPTIVAALAGFTLVAAPTTVAFAQSTIEADAQIAWEQIKGSWMTAKGAVKEQWGKLTDDDLLEARRQGADPLRHSARAGGGTGQRLGAPVPLTLRAAGIGDGSDRGHELPSGPVRRRSAERLGGAGIEGRCIAQQHRRFQVPQAAERSVALHEQARQFGLG